MAIDTAFVKQFGSNIELLAQQKGSKLRNAVRNETVVGEEAYFDQLGSTTAVQKTTRNSDTPLILGDHQRRRVSMYDYEWATLVDKEDQLKMLADPVSPFNQDAAFAMGRAMDAAIIAAFSGTAYTGKAGGTSTSFTAANQVAAASANLTLAKLLAAKKVLDKNDVDPDEARYMAITASQLYAMLNITTITSADYNSIKALVNGELNTFCGFTFIRTELLALSSTTRTCLAWAKGGMLLAMGAEVKAEITRRADKSYATQVYLAMSIGATRMQEKKCVEIACIES